MASGADDVSEQQGEETSAGANVGHAHAGFRAAGGDNRRTLVVDLASR